MRRLPLVVLLTLSVLLTVCGCSSSNEVRTAPPPVPAAGASKALPRGGTSAATSARSSGSSASPEVRCLPVVAKECGCVYACGRGVRDGDHWKVTHSFWKGTVLGAVIQRWCVHGQCTEAFAAEIVCAQICPPRPADPSCHLDSRGACVSRSREPMTHPVPR